ncbi:MAG: hypothetical protein FWC97_07045 [Treponema sp.]|nr:hypothetical protein [Treponema sp.]
MNEPHHGNQFLISPTGLFASRLPTSAWGCNFVCGVTDTGSVCLSLMRCPAYVNQ